MKWGQNSNSALDKDSLVRYFNRFGDVLNLDIGKRWFAFLRYKFPAEAKAAFLAGKEATHGYRDHMVNNQIVKVRRKTILGNEQRESEVRKLLIIAFLLTVPILAESDFYL